MKLKENPGNYSVVRLHPDSPIPEWVQKSRFYSIGKTDDELSIVCDTSVVPDLDIKRENGWKCLKVVGPLDFSLTGILSSIASPLAAAKISIFAVSTFDTDYIMVKEDSLQKTKEILTKATFTIV